MPKRKRPATGEVEPCPEAANSSQITKPRSKEDAPEKLPINDAATEEPSSKHKVAKKKRKRNKRKEKRKKIDAPASVKRSGGTENILNGLTLAVTTLDKKREDVSTGTDADSSSHTSNARQQRSLKNTIDRCKQYGASITSQVHRRVHALIVSDAALKNATQRVRKAIKLGIPIVDIGWVEACIKNGNRVDWADYLRTDEAKEAAESKKKTSLVVLNGEECGVCFDISADDGNATSGWSEPVELDCCCVCHENGDLECPWCTGETKCNITKKRTDPNMHRTNTK